MPSQRPVLDFLCGKWNFPLLSRIAPNLKKRICGMVMGGGSSLTVGIIGSNHLATDWIDGYTELQAQNFVNARALDGLKWSRQNTDNASWAIAGYVRLQKAGIAMLGIIISNPESSPGTLMSESQYKGIISTVLKNYPNCHEWEYGNEPQQYWKKISATHYFQGLIWANQVIKGTSGHASDTIIGPAETMWTGANGQVYDTDKLTWFKTLWSLKDSSTGLTPADIFTYVSIHMYTQNKLLTDTLTSGPYSGKTVATMLKAGLDAYHAVTGNAKDFMVTEWGWQAQYSSEYDKQKTFYQEAVPFFVQVGYIYGIFEYELVDNTGYYWGLFDSSLNAKPAWSVYKSYT